MTVQSLAPALVASRIRRFREAQGLTLRALAGRAGLSTGMLSMTERGERAPTLRTLAKVATALDVPLTTLVSPDPAPALPDHRPAAGADAASDADSGFVREALAPAMASRGVDIVRLTLTAGADSGWFPGHGPGALEHVNVLEGHVRLMTENDEMRLGPGDGATFDASGPHRAINETDAPCRYFVVIVTDRAAADATGGGA